MFKRILVPVDGSPTATRGLREAIRLVKGQRATIRLLHVVDRLSLVEGLEPPVVIEDRLRRMERAGHSSLEAARALTEKERIPTQAVMRKPLQGRVADGILDEASKWKAQVIVMGTHGRRGISRLVLGSDAENVLRQAKVPVLLVRGKPDPSVQVRRAR